METEKIQSLRDWVADNKSEALTAGRRVLLLEILDAALLARQKAADRLARHRGAQSPAKVPKIAQNRGKRPKKASAADRPIVPPQVQALTAKMEAGSEMGKPKDHSGYHAALKAAYTPPPPSEANPVFSMLKSKLPASAPHDPAATQFKTAKPKKP
jgi:hypothetical protein